MNINEYITIDYELRTVLGTSNVKVEVLKHDYELSGDIIFKPYEEERIHKEQCIKFLKYLHNKNCVNRFISLEEVRFLIRSLS